VKPAKDARELWARVRDAKDIGEIAREIADYGTHLGLARCALMTGTVFKEEPGETNIPLEDADGKIGAICCGGKLVDDQAERNEVAVQSLRELAPDITLVLRLRLLRQKVELRQVEREHLLRDLQKRNEDMLDELEQAREFQSQMLNRSPTVDGITLQTFYRPHDAVSGDFYDLFWNPSESRLRIFVADTTGHGVRGGLATMLLKAEYETIRRESATPSSVLENLNARIATLYRPGSLTLTAICVDLDPKTGTMTFASAAHPGPIVVSKDEARELPTGGSLIGVVPELAVISGTIKLERGESLYLYTDGITEATSESGELFGENRTLTTLREAHANGLDGTRSLARAAESFCRPAPFADDIAIVGVVLRD
jgi:serine phosphatase RsbU (regulator of sigma subunit)